jgi:predicted negative regulator of RcsB-dependent stress response
MATQHLDLEEQEQLAQAKAFWAQYGTLITTVVTVLALSYAGWQAWQFWQRKQAVEVAALFDHFDQAVSAGDLTRIDRVVSDMRAHSPKAALTQHAMMQAARIKALKGDQDAAIQLLQSVATESGPEGLQAIARVRWATLLLGQNKADAALQVLQTEVPDAFAGLVNDLKGDAYLTQGKRNEAAQAYRLAYSAFNDDMPQKSMVRIKLQALGINPDQTAPGVGS